MAVCDGMIGMLVCLHFSRAYMIYLSKTNHTGGVASLTAVRAIAHTTTYTNVHTQLQMSTSVLTYINTHGNRASGCEEQ